MGTMSNIIWVDKEIIKSKAFRSLRASSMIVYLDFLGKRRVKRIKRSRRRDDWEVTNNGRIEYTYSEAKKLGLTSPRFQRAIDELIEKGFIDITHQGSGGIKGDKSLYSISERWRKHGSPGFECKARTRDTRKGRGWALYHQIKRENHKSSEL